jgi:hypothetical protein
MKCREVRGALVAYLDGEVMPSERTLIDAHLGGCESCSRELATLGSSRSTLAGSLKTMAAQASPSPQAWIHLQASLAQQARSPEKTTRFLRKGDRPIRLRWRIALGTAGAALLAVAVIAAVPTSRAAAGDFFADVFNIKTGPSANLTYLPQGFQTSPGAVVGSISVNTEDAKGTEEALYRNGDRFILVKTSSDDGSGLPSGEAAAVNGVKAVLQSGLSGTSDAAPAPPDGKTDGLGTIQGAGSATVISGDTVITGVLGGDQEQGGIAVTPVSDVAPPATIGGQRIAMPPATFTYKDANKLTWVVNGTRVEVLSNLSVKELQKIAEGLVVND